VAGHHCRRYQDATSYWLRHSFLTESQLATGNVSSTQSLAMHSDIRMTRRYTLAAVAPELQRATDLVITRWRGQRTSITNSESQARPERATEDDR
jgi:hypothetical protein